MSCYSCGENHPYSRSPDTICAGCEKPYFPPLSQKEQTVAFDFQGNPIRLRDKVAYAVGGALYTAEVTAVGQTVNGGRTKTYITVEGAAGTITLRAKANLTFIHSVVKLK